MASRKEDPTLVLGQLAIYKHYSVRLVEFCPKDQSLSTDCPICLEPLGTDYSLSTCDHKFHTACLHTWRKTAKTCPMCRTGLPNNKVRHNEDQWKVAYSDGYDEVVPASKLRLIRGCPDVFNPYHANATSTFPGGVYC